MRVCIIGSGNWGSAIARIVGSNVKRHEQLDEQVNMWVYEEIIEGRKLSEIINTEHENTKYLPGKRLPSNVIALPDLAKSVKDADILIFVVPHQFVKAICEQILEHVKTDVIGISLIKGLATSQDGGIKLVSAVIQDILHIEVAVLMGANLAHEVADDQFCEATIGCARPESGSLLKLLFHTDNFRINVVKDCNSVELCGALKNIVACAAGFSDGLDYGDNTKAAVIRLGLMEMIKFTTHFFPVVNLQTFLESCGVADLVTTCYGGRNRKVCEAFVRSGKSIELLEKEMLNGQNLQGPQTARHIYQMLHKAELNDSYPLFSIVHLICIGDRKPESFISSLRNHPEHM